jgi:hypothetical protein
LARSASGVDRLRPSGAFWYSLVGVHGLRSCGLHPRQIACAPFGAEESIADWGVNGARGDERGAGGSWTLSLRSRARQELGCVWGEWGAGGSWSLSLRSRAREEGVHGVGCAGGGGGRRLMG